MKKYIYLLSFMFHAFSVHAQDPSDAIDPMSGMTGRECVALYRSAECLQFEEGEVFQGEVFRKSGKCPIYLKAACDINITNDGMNLMGYGFNAILYNDNPDEHKNIGYITYSYGCSPHVNMNWTMIFEEYRNKGYGTEAVKTFLRAIKENKHKFPLAKSVRTSTFPTNSSMRRILEESGFQLVAEQDTYTMIRELSVYSYPIN